MAMTREQIREKWDGMTPRERDTWVAEVVQPPVPSVLCFYVLPHYTTDISAAELVLAKIPGEVYIYRKTTGGFVVSFGYSTDDCPECGEDSFEVQAQGIAMTLSEAICLAALIAKLSESSV